MSEVKKRKPRDKERKDQDLHLRLVCVAVPARCVLFVIRKMMPRKLRKTPPALRHVMGSFSV